MLALLVILSFYAASVDYTPVNTTITFTENGMSEIALNINITNDNFSEGVERFLGNLMLVASTGLASRITIFRPQTEVIIEDDDCEWHLVCGLPLEL